jgi:hypothetical protein
VIDWLMRLRPELERDLLQELERFEEVRRMPYVTSAERIGIEKGIQQGREEGLQQGLRAGLELALKLKFGAAAAEFLPEIRQLTDLATIQAIYAQLEAASTIDDVRRIYR